MRKSKETEQICWDCVKATGACPWSNTFTPITGWTAKPTVIKEGKKPIIESFQISNCPLFEKQDCANWAEIKRKMAECLKVTATQYVTKKTADEWVAKYEEAGGEPLPKWVNYIQFDEEMS